VPIFYAKPWKTLDDVHYHLEKKNVFITGAAKQVTVLKYPLTAPPLFRVMDRTI